MKPIQIFKKLVILSFLMVLLISPTFAGEKDGKKFQLEFYGGFATMSPADLNLEPEFREKLFQFRIDDQLNYFVDGGLIVSWSKTMEGELKRIKNAAPFGVRLKYFLNESIAFSLGVKYQFKDQSSNFTMPGEMLFLDGQEMTWETGFSYYSIEARGFTPMLGVHFLKNLGRRVGIEGYVTAGPLFGKCNLSITANEWQRMDGQLVYDLTGSTDMTGKGTGFAVDVGARVNVDLGKDFLLFIEGGYAYQVVKKLSGKGSENSPDGSFYWEGDWNIINVSGSEEWGTINALYPSNYWEEGMSKSRDFKLDLSGFQLKGGIAYRF